MSTLSPADQQRAVDLAMELAKGMPPDYSDPVLAMGAISFVIALADGATPADRQVINVIVAQAAGQLAGLPLLAA